MKTKTKNCLIKNCHSVQKTRGICNTHYCSLVKMVRFGEVTWKQLEENKIVLESKKGDKKSLLLEALKNIK